MAEIVLNRYDAASDRLLSLEKAKVEQILKQVVPTGTDKIRLHCEWAEPPEYIDWLFTELKKLGVGSTLVTRSIHDLKRVWDHLDNTTFIELFLHRDQKAEDYSDLEIKFHLSYFIAIDAISPDGSLYQGVLDQVKHHPFKTTLGVNWQSPFSGPEPMDEGDYAAWADTIIALVEALSKKKINSEFACGLKLCIFSREQLGYLPTRLINWPIAMCARTYVYDVDGSLSPCMRLKNAGEKQFSSSDDIMQVTEDFLNWLSPYVGHCLESDTLACRCLKARSCQTGCVAHTIDEFSS